MKRLFALSLIPLLLGSCSKVPVQRKYGVFLGVDSGDISFMKEYETVVLDAQYYSKEQIQDLKYGCSRVLSYLNIGAIENFRPYYNTYSQYALGDYENWPEEKWMNVSNVSWQNFLITELAEELIEKGVDGFYLDNADVFYHYHTDEIFNGLTTIIKSIGNNDSVYLLLNGGDTYVSEYLARYDELNIINGINQETVFTKINWDLNTFSKADKEDQKYFQEYIETVSTKLNDIYLLEYSKNNSLIRKIDSYCNKHGFKYYVSSTLELLKP